MKVYTYSQAREKLSSVLDEAAREGVVQIRRRDGRVFAVKPVTSAKSPLDVPGLSTDISADEIVRVVREGRERAYANSSRPGRRAIRKITGA